MEIVLVNNNVSGIGDNFSDAKFYFRKYPKGTLSETIRLLWKSESMFDAKLQFSVNIERCDNIEEVKKIIHDMPKNLQEWILKK